MIITLIIPFAIYYGYIRSFPSYGDKSIGATIRYKIDLIQQTEGERIILVGGSSSPYGTICDEFEKIFDKPCINIGATAYLGLEYYINILDAYAREGDIVVLAPEHILYKGQSVDYCTMWISVGDDLDALRLIPISYYAGMFSAFKDYSALRKNSNDNATQGQINSHFGPKGDVIIERERLLESGYNIQDIIYLDKEQICWDNLKLINDFCKKAERKDISVYMAFAPVNKLAIATDNEENTAFEKAIREYINAEFLVDLDTSIMAGEYFYDSNNHLTTAGAKIYTANMIDGLKEYIS